MISDVKVRVKMMMLQSALLGRETANTLLRKEEKDKREQQKYLAMRSFMRAYYTCVMYNYIWL